MNERLNDYKTYLINLHKSLIYYNYLMPLVEYLQEKNLTFETLTKEELAQYFTDKKYKSGSINCLLKAGKDFCKFIEQENSPFKEIKLLKTETKTPDYLTLEDIERAIKMIATEKKRLNVNKSEIVLLMMFYLGLRKSELLLAKREDFDLVNCMVKIHHKKTKEESILPIPNKLMKKLVNYFNSEPEEINAFNITLAEVNYLFRNVLSHYLGRKIHPHLTRSGCATYLAEKGIQTNVIQKILNHKSILTTMRYTEPKQKDIERLYREKIK